MDGEVYGGHIMVHQPWKGAVRLVCMCRDFMNWHGAHGVDWVEAECRAQHGYSNSAQNTLRDWCGDACA